MERILSEIKNTADKVAKKSGELVELSKVKLGMANTKSEIGTNYKILGELVYRSQKEDATPDAEKIEEIIAKIDELFERLKEYAEISSALKNEKVCPICTKTNPATSKFCNDCGYKFDVPKGNDEDVEVFTDVEVL